MAQDTHDDTTEEPDTEQQMLSALDVGAKVTLPGGDEPVVLIDRVRPTDYGNSIWAYEHADSGDYEGMVEDGEGVNAMPVNVDFHGYQ